jgi:hypothetical protein
MERASSSLKNSFPSNSVLSAKKVRFYKICKPISKKILKNMEKLIKSAQGGEFINGHTIKKDVPKLEMKIKLR